MQPESMPQKAVFPGYFEAYFRMTPAGDALHAAFAAKLDDCTAGQAAYFLKQAA